VNGQQSQSQSQSIFPNYLIVEMGSGQRICFIISKLEKEEAKNQGVGSIFPDYLIGWPVTG